MGAATRYDLAFWSFLITTHIYIASDYKYAAWSAGVCIVSALFFFYRICRNVS